MVPSENKYLFNGKELQDEQLGGINLDLYDYHSRFYDPALARFTTQDPLADEFSSWTPYHYVYNNPINLVDPTGMWADGYTIDDDGYIERVDDTGGKEYDVLYAKKEYEVAKASGETNSYGNPEPENQAKVTNTSVLSSLSTTQKYGSDFSISSYTSGSSGVNDVFNVFKFASDNSNAEWGLARFNNNGADNYWIGTLHNEGHSPTTQGAGLSNVISHVHSHPNIPLNSERSSMGDYGQTYEHDSDIGKKIRGERPYNMYVYFPSSKNLHHVSKNNTEYVRNIGNNYKRFYFGVLNHK